MKISGNPKVWLVILTLICVIYPIPGIQAHRDKPVGALLTEIGKTQSAYQIETQESQEIIFTLADGSELVKHVINGPPNPPAGFEAERLVTMTFTSDAVILPNFPSYDWVFGCSAVAGAMIAGWYDRGLYPKMYEGPANGGVMPLSDIDWPTWSDGYSVYPNNPLVASHKTVDGRVLNGSIDNYWVSYMSMEDDPYITHGWTHHIWGTAIGDYMKTSQSAYGNPDGATIFYNWNTLSSPLTCSDMEYLRPENTSDLIQFLKDIDGTYGRKLFYEARGYTVSDCYNRLTNNMISGGFSLSDFQSEINAGHPVFLNLRGHSVVGFGYSGSTIYIRDTWNNDPGNVYSMIWGGSYMGMELVSVGIVRLAPVPPQPPTDVVASEGKFNNKIRLSWNPSLGAENYQIFRSSEDESTNAVIISDEHSGSPYDDDSAHFGRDYYYWVKACNFVGCSDFSLHGLGWLGETSDDDAPPVPPVHVQASKGTYFDKVKITWEHTENAYYYEVFRNTSNTTSDSTRLISNLTDNYFNDFEPEPEITFYYWVKACNIADCSGFSSPDFGWVGTSSSIPAPPTGMWATQGDFTDRVKITWNPVDNATHYQIFRHIENTNQGAQTLTLNHNSSPFDDITATPGQEYNYWAKACNGDSCSAFSLPVLGWRDLPPIDNFIYLPLVIFQ